MRLGVWTGTALRYVLAALAPVGAVVLGDLILWRAQGLLPAPPGHGVTLAIAILRFLLAVAAVALSGRIAAPGRPMHFVNVLSTAWAALFVVDLLILHYALPGIHSLRASGRRIACGGGRRMADCRHSGGRFRHRLVAAAKFGIPKHTALAKPPEIG